jgi:hypothetical protein
VSDEQRDLFDGQAKIKTFQGASGITRKKEHNFAGLAYMQIMMRANAFAGLPGKGYVQKLRITDALCGNGLNLVEGEIVEGSPYAILNSLLKAAEKNDNILRAATRKQIQIFCSDINRDSVASLDGVLRQDFEERFCNLFRVNDLSGMVQIERLPAADAVRRDTEWLQSSRGNWLAQTIDPNGIKDLPFCELHNLLASEAGRRRASVTINISATAIKRVLAVPQAQKQISDWLSEFRKMFIETLGSNEKAWVRLPVEGDRWQWTMVTYWPTKPASDWRSAGFVDIKSAEGDEAIRRYSDVSSKRTT